VSPPDTLRNRAIGVLAERWLTSLSGLARFHPLANERRHGVEVDRNVRYSPGKGKAHLLDVYRPNRPGPHPVVLYLHGGGFRILSKDSHFLMGLGFARAGYVTIVPSYRLAPEHPFPAAVEDCAAALAWSAENAARYGGDVSRLAIAGESAGGNLAVAMVLATCQRRPEPYARRAFDLGVVPSALLPYCGLHQVSDIERFGRRRRLPPVMIDRMKVIERSYLKGPQDAENPSLADPLLVLEKGPSLERPWPATFATVGTADPILDDTRRLGAAIDRLGAPCEVRYYPREPHAFHAFVWRPAARQCWLDSYAFLARTLPREP